MPPFWGCCSVNACAEKGCVGGARGNLSGAYLSSNPSVAAAFLSMVGTSYPISTSTSALAATASLIAWTSATASSSSSPEAVTITKITTATATTTAATTRTTTSSTTSSSSSKNTTSHVGAIVGGTVAGVAVVLAFILGLLFLCRRREAAATATAATADDDDGGDGGGSSDGIPMSTIPHQQSPSNIQPMLDIDQNTHPALRKPPISPVAAAEEQGPIQSIANVGESRIGAYGK